MEERKNMDGKKKEDGGWKGGRRGMERKKMDRIKKKERWKEETWTERRKKIEGRRKK